MLRLLNIFLVLMVLASAFTIYSLEHETRRGERRIVALNRQIADEQEMIRLLEAEWSNLARPRRIEQLAAKHLKLAPMSPLQLVRPDDLVTRLPERPPVAAATQADPIGDILRVMR